MNAEAPLEALRVVCPHCSATNRVPANRLEEARSAARASGLCSTGTRSSSVQPSWIVTWRIAICRLWSISGRPGALPAAPWRPIFEHVAQQLEPHARFVKLNTDKNQAIASRLDIRGIPTLMVFKNGKEVARVAGAMDAGRFRAWVQAHL